MPVGDERSLDRMLRGWVPGGAPPCLGVPAEVTQVIPALLQDHQALADRGDLGADLVVSPGREPQVGGRALLHVPAGIDRDVVPGDVLRSLRQEEIDRRRDVLLLDESPQRGL